MGLLHRFIVALVLGLGILGLVAAPAQAAPATGATDSTGSTATTVFKLNQDVQIQVDALTAQAQAAQTEIDALDLELARQTGEYSKCLADLDAAHARMTELRRMVADARAKKAHAQGMLAERIRAVYKSGGRDQLLQLLLLADGMKDLYNRVRLVSVLADQDKRLVANLKESTTRLDLLVKAIDDQKGQELALRGQLSDRTAEIEATMAQKEQKLAGLDERIRAIIEQERQRQVAERARLQQELQARLLAAQAAVLNYGTDGGQLARRGPNILKPEQIALVAQKAGFTGNNLVIAVAVALAESSGNANAMGDVTIGGSFGLWQIYCMAHPYLIPPSSPDSVAWYDPYQNAQWAYRISGGSNWRPWSTYIHGTYRTFMPVARAAVSLIGADEPSAGDLRADDLGDDLGADPPSADDLREEPQS